MDWTIQFDEAVSRYLPDLKVVCDEPMSRHTTFRIGGPADVFIRQGGWLPHPAGSSWCCC